METINLTDYSEIVILTGAGISAGSGIRTFRGPGGALENNARKTFSLESLMENPSQVWKQYGQMRSQTSQAKPNAAHIALSIIEDQLKDKEFTLITQNVDGLHKKAGSKNVVELHGNLLKKRCTNEKCTLESFKDFNSYDGQLPHCPECGSALRPDVVFFDEKIPLDEEWLSKKALRTCDLFIAIGTSGTVSPASNFVRSAEYAGARTILMNLTGMEPLNPYFKEEYLGKAEEIVPQFFGINS